MRLFNNIPVLLLCLGLQQALASSQLHNTSNLPESPTGLPPSSEIVSHAQENAQSGLCCSALSFVLGDKVSYPNQQSYQDSLASYWSAQEASLSPKCVVTPKSVKDVSSAVFVLSLLSTRTNFSAACKFAIRSGGHTPWPGSANIHGGVTIDMKFLNQVAVSPDQTVTSVGPGNRWIDVYLKLDAMGLALPGGRVAEVGVGGLILGGPILGGISFFGPRYGFVCDNVLNYEIVLADGQIVNANQTSLPDLFRSLKGGSNNFGVVTRFDIKTFKQGNFWGGTISYNISSREQHFKAFEAFAASRAYDPYSALINNYAYAAIAGGWFISNDYEYTKQPAEPYPPTFSGFTSIKPELQNTMRISNLSDFTLEIDQSTPNGARSLFLTLNHAPSAALMSTLLSIANSTLQPVIHTPSIVWAISLQPIPPSVTAVAASTGGNVLGLDPAAGAFVITLLSVTWANAADDDAVNAAARKWLRKSEEAARDGGWGRKWLYLNYADKTQDVIAGYGEQNVEFLRGVSKEVDLEGVFQRGVTGGFKLLGRE